MLILSISLSSKAQVIKRNANDDKVNMSIGVTLPKFGLIYEIRLKKFGGVGFDFTLLDDGTTFGRDYSETMSVNSVVNSLRDPTKGYTYEDTNGFGIYYITPTYRGFDLSIGIGSITQYQYQQFFDNHYILSKSGDYFVSTGEFIRTSYTSFGITKSVRLSDDINVDLKLMNRLYSNGLSEPNFGIGVRMGFGY